MGHKLAIDFGTTNSAVAGWDPSLGAARLVTLPGISCREDNGRQPLIPSLLYVTDGRTGEAAIGQTVLDNQLNTRRDNRLFRNFKRGILTQPYPEARLIDGVPWSDQNAGRRFIEGLIAGLPYSPQEIEQLVITAPVAAFDSYILWLSETMQSFLPDAVRIVDESTAAALGYSVTEPEAIVLVFDFGGGSLDLSLVQLPENREKSGGLLQKLKGGLGRRHTAHVIAKAGLSLGGSDIDHWLLAEALERCRLQVDALGNDYPALLTACEQAKVLLSDQEEITIQFQVCGVPYSLPFTRPELEALLAASNFYTSLKRILDKVMHIAQRQGVFKEDITHVLMVGGVSLIPSVQATLKNYFSEDAVRVEKPFTAVVEGALQVAAGFGLEDYLTFSYGLRYLDPGSGQRRYDEIIPMGSRYPTNKPVKLNLQAAHPGQTEIEFIIAEISLDAVSMVEVKYEDGQAVFVAHASPDEQQIAPLNAQDPILVHLSPPGRPGVDRLQAQFSVDQQRQLLLSVTDLSTRKKLLRNTVVARLGESQTEPMPHAERTGSEPCLSTSQARPGQQQLSLRGLGTMLNSLPPEAISLEAATHALYSKEFYVRFSAAEILSRRGDRDARLILQGVLEKGNPPQRASVANHLHRFSWYVAEPLLRQALEDPDLRVREAAIYALCRLRGFNAYQLMQEALSHEVDSVRMAAVWGLSRRPDPDSIPVLELALLAQDPEVRVLALEVMSATESKNALPAVLSALDDPHLDVKYAAVLSWIELAGADCFPELAALLERSVGQERLYLMKGLFHATNYLFIDIAASPAGNGIMNMIEAALQDELPETRLTAAMLLAWMRTERAAQTLQAGYHREPDGEIKARILFAAVNLMSPVYGALMESALQDADPAVHDAAQYLAKRQ